MNLKEVQQRLDNAKANGIVYIQGQREVYPKGMYIVIPVMDDNEELQFKEFDTFHKLESANGVQINLKGFSLYVTGRHVETGEEFNDMRLTANSAVIKAVEKNPKAGLLVKTQTRKRSNGNGFYQILILGASGTLQELKEKAKEMLHPDRKEVVED